AWSFERITSMQLLIVSGETNRRWAICLFRSPSAISWSTSVSRVVSRSLKLAEAGEGRKLRGGVISGCATHHIEGEGSVGRKATDGGSSPPLDRLAERRRHLAADRRPGAREPHALGDLADPEQARRLGRGAALQVAQLERRPQCRRQP